MGTSPRGSAAAPPRRGEGPNPGLLSPVPSPGRGGRRRGAGRGPSSVSWVRHVENSHEAFPCNDAVSPAARSRRAYLRQDSPNGSGPEAEPFDGAR